MPPNTCTSGLSKSKPLSRCKSLINDYGIWLNSYHWDYYCTFTTRYQLSKNAARTMMGKMCLQMKEKHNIEPVIFWVAEPFDTKYGCHLHALVNIANKAIITKIDLKNIWQVVSRGKGKKEYNNTTIKDYDPLMGGHFYISKYLQRPGLEYDLF